MACRMDDPVFSWNTRVSIPKGYAVSPDQMKIIYCLFGEANLVQEGTDISIITWGAMVQQSIDAVNSFSLDDGL
ncbi:MAG: hypothetical protein CM1200mP10_18810 [Candidatus Neomarinimicrobiota bacterium]|nr:MAG: hypothetical protein CM1200mP10_18810 [Candidatus Neomarinimicrobiota bacterium]